MLLLFLTLSLLPQLQPPGHSAVRAGPFDLTPVKAPLERLATAAEAALAQAQALRADAARLIHWPVIAASVLLTMLIMHTIHLHGLAASKSNLSEGKRP
jgi:hypothetical protein